MRREYSIAVLGLLLAAAATAAPCPSALTEISGRVAQLRHVPVPFDPPCRLIRPGELRGALDLKLRRDLPVAPELFLQALSRAGFIDGDPSTIYSQLLTFYTSQVLGFYEPQADEMVVVDTPAAARIEGALVWAHELAHAAQEHRFHLPSRLVAMKGDSDEQRAASAVAEGEAMLVMFLLNSPASGDEQLSDAESAVGRQAQTLSPPPGVPPYFVADLIFPYTAGFSAALRAYRAGGWPAVDHLLAHPPTSTTELLHPERPDAPGTVPASELPPVPFAGAPWTVAAYMVEGQGSRDFAAARHWAVTEPDSFARLIEMLVEATAEHLCAQIEAGAGAVQIFDSWAGSLSAADFERWSMRPTAEIVRRVKSRHPNARVIGFPRGCGARAAEYANATGVDAVSIDQATVAERARDELRVAVQGNLDPVLLMAGGAAMAREVTHLRSVFAGRPFIFNLGHGVLPATPPDHVAELVRLVRA